MMLVMHPFNKNFMHPALFQVLYRFLDYFSKFNWDNYCVSLKGPVAKSSPPDVVGMQGIFGIIK